MAERDMSDELTLDERIEAWRKRWNRKIGADLFNNRKQDLKAMFRSRRWSVGNSEKLAGRLFRVKEYHELHKTCPTCKGHSYPLPRPAPGAYTDAKIELGYYNERLDRYGHYQINDVVSPRYVMPGSIVFATGKYIERRFWDFDNPPETSRQIEILTEKAIGYVEYDYLRPIKKSEAERLKSMG